MMSKITIYPSKVRGSVKISGSKNSALAIIAASCVVGRKIKLENVPDISDVFNMIRLLEKIGCKVNYKKDKLSIINDCKNISLRLDETKKIRASYYFMSVYLALFKEVSIYLPGGCDIGSRPIDFHLEGFKKAGCVVEIENDSVKVSAKELKPFEYTLPKKSMGATVNLMILASKIQGKSIIKNASTEPEIDDLISFINCGDSYAFRDNDDIVIYGSESIKEKVKYRIMSDRIEAFTFMCIGTNSKKLVIKNINLNHLKSPLKCLKDIGVKYKIRKKDIVFYKSKLKSTTVFSNHYPSLSTDQMPLLYPLLIRASGLSVCKEEIFESRFKVCEELLKIGADIDIQKDIIFINGNNNLVGCDLYASDLRAAACLLVEAIFNGNSTVHNLHYLERGYSQIYKKLKKINIKYKLVF